MKILATYNIKGGVGKTAAAVNLAYIAAREGFRTLLWDLDPQGSASFYLRARGNTRTDAEAIISRKRDLDSAVKNTGFKRLDLIPAEFSFRSMDTALSKSAKPTVQLMKLLRPLSARYDLLFLDCAPSVSLVSENVFYAADALLVPLIPTTLSVHAYYQLVRHFKPHFVNGLNILPFFTMIDCRKRLHRDTVATLRSLHPEILEIGIPNASQVELMGVQRAPLASFAPKSIPALAYEELWRAVVAQVR